MKTFLSILFLLSATPSFANFVYETYTLKTGDGCVSLDSPDLGENEFEMAYDTYVCFKNRYTGVSHLGYLSHDFTRGPNYFTAALNPGHDYRADATKDCETSRVSAMNKVVDIKNTPCKDMPWDPQF